MNEFKGGSRILSMTNVDFNPVELIKGCFDGEPLMKVMNISGNFDLNKAFAGFNADGIKASTFDFKTLDEYSAKVDSLSVEKFGLYEQNITDALDALNEAKDSNDPKSYTREDCRVLESCAPQYTVGG